MRILLVSANRESIPYAVAPLGIAYIAGAARSEGHEIALLDLCFSANLEADIARTIPVVRPDLIGISIRNVDNLTYPTSVSYLEEIYAAVAAMRKASCAPIVGGGAGFSLFPERMLSYLDLDFGVIGEGEETFCLLARKLAKGLDARGLPNLIRRGQDACQVARKAAPFATNGRPARDLLDNARYRELGGMANLQTKRGCPFRCAYCTYPQIEGAALRLRSPGEVVSELEAMVEERALGDVFFVDDIFNWPPDHAMSICDAIVARGLQVAWTCFATPLGMNVELARAMKRAGCRGVEFGTDSASPPVLRALGKPFAQEDILMASRACREVGLPDAHYLIFGGPAETSETMAQTFAFFDEVGPRAVLAFLGVRIYPNTPLHGVAMADGVISGDDDLLFPHFYISPRVDAEVLKSTVRSHAEARPNWVVPGLGIRSDPALLAALRRMGRRGPLWDLL